MQVLDLIHRETIRYTDQYPEGGGGLPGTNYCHEYLWFSHVEVQAIRSYWSKSWPFSSDNFSSLMSSRRFELILQFLHLNDSEMQPRRGAAGFDKLYKIRPLLN